MSDNTETSETATPLTFEPIDVGFDYTAESFNNPHLVNVRAASVLLSKTPDELREMIHGPDADQTILADIVDGIIGTSELFQSLQEMMDAATARVFLVLDQAEPASAETTAKAA